MRTGYTALTRNNSNLLTRRRVPGLAVKTSGGPSTSPGTGTITLTTPVAYQVFQRGAGSQGSIAIAGTYTGTPGAMEASFNGGGWTRLCDQPSSGVFSGTIANQAAGQGTLQVRWIGNAGSAASVAYVGIGDIFILAGQSNNVGMADAHLAYSHATLKAVVFANDYTWKELLDPPGLDDPTGQVDTVSGDPLSWGHWAIPMSTSYLAGMGGIPVAWVPCALGGSAMVDWQPGANHTNRATLYGSMIYRAIQVGGCRAVLWWQGEEDALRATSRAQYNTWLDTLADTIYADLGVQTMVCRIELLAHDPWVADTSLVNGAIADALADNAHVLAGPDFSAIDWGTAHYTAAVAVSTVGPGWWAAMRAAWGW
jgi:hypothetical protein